MKQSVWLDGVAHTLELTPGDGGWVFRLNGEEGTVSCVEVEPGVYSLLWDGSSFEAVVTLNGDQGVVKIGGEVVGVRIEDPREISEAATSPAGSGRHDLTAPMPGRVVDLLVEEGQTVKAGQGAIVVEAMKMQNELRTAIAGRVVRVLVGRGDAVAAGDVLVSVESGEVAHA